jgi:AcrR family transcriptional regulator
MELSNASAIDCLIRDKYPGIHDCIVISMNTTTSRRREATEQRRLAILRAARKVFARKGYTETVVDDIAAEADIGKGTLYLYFPSKEQIYLAALMEDARKLNRLTRDSMAAAATWRDKLRAYLDVRLQYFDSHQDFVRIYMTEFRNMCMQGKALAPELHHLIREGEEQLAQLFAVATARGEVRAVDPELAALTVSDLTRGIMERRLRGWGGPASPADAAFALDVLCRALAAQA